MALCSSRRSIIKFATIASSWSRLSFCSRTSNSLDNDVAESQHEMLSDGQKKAMDKMQHFSPLFSSSPPSKGYAIEVVDDDAWHISTGLAQAWHRREVPLKRQNFDGSAQKRKDNNALHGDIEEEGDFDEVDNMRMRGSLFYKLEKASMEFEEYNFDFHRKKSPKRKEDPKETEEEKKKKKKNTVSCDAKPNNKRTALPLPLPSLLHEAPPFPGDLKEKKVRTPTFNQLTAPYHQPFCLDIFISNASVRACVIHRVTSKVVAVAHSISKDMKFDLRSTRNAAACAAVGEILAQRALADDIHDVVYTPRRGEVLEGKLEIVLQSIIDNGVKVKVKLKQRMQKKYHHHVYHRSTNL